MVQKARQNRVLSQEMGENVNFKVGDKVWCIDPTNKHGLYSFTYYHRPCVVVDIVGSDEIIVKIADPQNGFEKNAFRVDKHRFGYIKYNCKVV